MKNYYNVTLLNCLVNYHESSQGKSGYLVIEKEGGILNY